MLYNGKSDSSPLVSVVFHHPTCMVFKYFSLLFLMCAWIEWRETVLEQINFGTTSKQSVHIFSEVDAAEMVPSKFSGFKLNGVNNED